MLSQKEKRFAAQVVSLEQLVPEDNFYRQLEDNLDLSFVYALVTDCSASSLGRPAMDPVVFCKLQLILCCEGMRSARQLMELVNLNLAYRWYIGYDLDEPVPDHSSLSKIRDRYGLVVFERFFERIVEVCQEAGLVWGKELYFDGTKIRANAALEGMVPRWYWEAQHHLTMLFVEEPTACPPETAPAQSESPAPAPAKPGLARLVEKYDGTRRSGRGHAAYQRVTDSMVSPTDPAARPMSRLRGDRATLGYHTHDVVDGGYPLGEARIILAALVTPASMMDNTPMLDLACWVRCRWHLHPKLAVGDTRYGTVENIVGLEQQGMRAYLPTPDLSQRNEFYPAADFLYDQTRDLYLCPQGHALPLHARRKSEAVLVYRAAAATCNACPVKADCTNSTSGRHIFRSFYQAYLDQAAAYRATEAYKKAIRKRLVWVEPLFGEGKQWHHMARFRLRGLEKVNIEGVLKAAGQNIKRLLSSKEWWNPKHPVGGALLLPFILLFALLLTAIPYHWALVCKGLFQHAEIFGDRRP